MPTDTNIFQLITTPCPASMKALQSELLGKASALQAEIADFLASIRANAVRTLEQEHAAVVVSCRSAMDAVIEAQGLAASAEGLFIQATNRAEGARSALAEFLPTKPRPESYPTQAELQNWEEKLAVVRANLDDFVTAQRAAGFAHGQQQSLLAQARAEFAPLRIREEDLRKRIINEGGSVPGLEAA